MGILKLQFLDLLIFVQPNIYNSENCCPLSIQRKISREQTIKTTLSLRCSRIQKHTRPRVILPRVGIVIFLHPGAELLIAQLHTGYRIDPVYRKGYRTFILQTEYVWT